MRTSAGTLSVALALLANSHHAAAVAVRRQDSAYPGNSAAQVAKSFIVEYERGGLRLRSDDESLRVVRTFDSDIFVGASVESNTHNVESIRRLGGVKNVWANTRVTLSPVQPASTFQDVASAGDYSIHNTTGVSKLHAMGIFGEGVKVGIVDGGTDYNHAALGGGFGPGFKVAAGYDFVGDKYWPTDNTAKEPDEDPMDRTGHGTHVAGIVAGSNAAGWVGVAPKATIHSYKVFSRASATDAATLIDAFLRAYNDGVDIITASVGGPDGWSGNVWATVASRIADQGVVVTIAAGNSGSDGPFFGFDGAVGDSVVGVASINADKLPASAFGVTAKAADGSTTTTTEGYLPATYNFPPTIVNWEVRPMSFNITDPAEACTPYPAGTRRLDGVIPLVRRGTCTIAVKQGNLQALGAEYVLFYNNERPLENLGTTELGSLVSGITAEVGHRIIDIVKAGGNVTADFSLNPDKPLGLDYPAGGLPSIFTTWGGTNELKIKPDVAAPGGNIFSTWPGNTYALLSGTSMACPYVAGIAALYIGAHGGRAKHGKGFSKMLATRMIASGRSVPWFDGTFPANYDLPASVSQVGTGLIDAFKVVQYSTDITFEKMALNDTHHFNRYHSVGLANRGDKPVTYTFSVEAAAGVETAAWYPISPTLNELHLKRFAELKPVAGMVPQISLPKSFTLQPGQNKEVTVSFDNPDKLGWNSSAIPMYSGKVLVSGSNGEQFAVPYMGIATNMERELVPNFRTTYPFSRSMVAFIDIKQKPYYTFNLARNVQDFPKIFVKTTWATQEIRWDIYEAGWTERKWSYPPVPGENGYIGPAASWVGSGLQSVFDPARWNPDETFTFPVNYMPRNAFSTNSYDEFWWFGKLGNGSQIVPGNYTMRFASLHLFGNPQNANNWDVFKTPTIEVRGKY